MAYLADQFLSLFNTVIKAKSFIIQGTSHQCEQRLQNFATLVKLKSLGILRAYLVFGLTLANFVYIFTNFHCFKWPNID